MRKQIQLLVTLQVVDKTRYGLEQEQQAIPLRLEELDQGESSLRESVEQDQAELDQLIARREELEKANEAVAARLRRTENRMMGAKTQREYQAAKAEIQEANDAKKGNEDLILELMERQEQLEGRLAPAREKLEQLSQEAGEERKSLTKRAKAVGQELASLDKKRQGLAGKVEASLLKRYDFIRERRQGVALASVNNGTCAVCHMEIPPQQYNELQRMDQLMTCPSCNRLIYWAEAEGLENAP